MPRHAWLLLLLATPRLGAQSELSVGLGVGSIRYTGGTSLASATLSPVGVLAGPAWSTALGGSVGPLGDGAWAGQLRADLWAAWPAAQGLRPAASVVLEGSAQSGGPATGAAHLLAEVAWLRDGAGFAAGLGPSLGAIAATPQVAGLRSRARAWGRLGNVAASAAVEPQRLQESWFTDVVLGVSTPRDRVTVSGWATARFSQGYGSSAAGSVALQVTLNPRFELEAAGGSYLPDLYQGFPASGFVSLGIRAFLSPRPARVRPTAPTVLRPAMAVRESDSVRVRFAVRGAARVAIAGEWSEWRPVTLARVNSDLWEARLALPRGIHRFSLVVDGVRWFVPPGVAVVDDGMGGSVGLLLVP